MDKNYIIECKSWEGTYFVVNGWHKHKTFFTRKIVNCNKFKRERDAKSSLTKLIKTSKIYGLGYEKDKYEIKEI